VSISYPIPFFYSGASSFGLQAVPIESTDDNVGYRANPRGIPIAPFIEDVEAFVPDRTKIEENLAKFQEMIAYVSYIFAAGDRKLTKEVSTNSWS
jgi:hypothetical protein